MDQLRTVYPGFNHSWMLFFGTCPPGIHPKGVFFTETEREELTREVSSFAGGAGSKIVERYDPVVHNSRRLKEQCVDEVHGSK